MAAENQPDNVIAFSGNTMVYESIKRFAVKGLNELIRDLMENIDDALFDLSEKVESDHERNRYFDAMREIRRKRHHIEQEFDAEIQQRFADLLLENQPRTQVDDSDELSLVGHDEVEDQLAIDNMVGKARTRCEDDLFALSERLREVLRRSRIQPDQNPLDPRAICDSFHEASTGLDSDIQVKLIFYKMFDRFVISRLGEFYPVVNDYCIEKGILPNLKAAEARIKQSTRFMSRRGSTETHAGTLPDAIGDDTAAYEGEAAESGGNLLTALRRLFGPITGAAPGGATAAIPGTPDGAADGLGELAAGTAGAALNPAYAGALAGLQAAVLSAPPTQLVTPAQVRDTTHQQLVEFRDSIGPNASPADNQIIDIVSMLFDFFFDDEALPDPIKVHIGRMQIPILKLAMIDPNFFNQKKHPARQLLDLFSHASMGWSENFQEEKVLIDKIEEIVNYLLDEFDQDVSVFETALNRFNEFMTAEQEKADTELRSIDAEEKERDARLRQADQEVSAFVRKMLSKHEMGFSVVDFLEGVWSNVLRSALASEGRDSPHWKNLKRITTTLVWTLIPKDNEEDKGKLLKTLPSLLRALSRGMELVQTDSEAQNRVFKMLVLEHAKVVKQTARNIVTRVDDETIWPESGAAAALAGFTSGEDEDVDIEIGEDANGDITIIRNDEDESVQTESLHRVTATPARQVVANLEEFTASVNEGAIEIDEEIVLDSAQAQFDRTQQQATDDDGYSEAARALKIGDWVKLTDEDQNSVNAKLSWKSNVTGKYVFVNRHGAKVRNMTVNGLAMELRSGRAEITESVSMFDRAVNSLLKKIH